MMDTYEAFGIPVPFRNHFFDEAEYGQLNTHSLPIARLFIDGNDTGLMTPVNDLPLLPGVPQLRYVNEALGIDRAYDCTIVLNMTTQIDVELR